MTALADAMADTTAWIGPSGTAHRDPVAGLAFCGQVLRHARRADVGRVKADRLCPACWPGRIPARAPDRRRRKGARA